MASTPLIESGSGEAGRKSLAARFIDALHRSRRIEARRLLLSHRHLNAEVCRGLRTDSASILHKAKEEGSENADRDSTFARVHPPTLQGA
jgi:hypothetical protein